MKYMIICVETAEDFAKRNDPVQAGPYWNSWSAYSEAVAKAGIFVSGAGLTPPETYTLRVKLAGDRPQKVELDERVDLRRPGVEKFKALPRDQQEG